MLEKRSIKISTYGIVGKPYPPCTYKVSGCYDQHGIDDQSPCGVLLNNGWKLQKEPGQRGVYFYVTSPNGACKNPRVFMELPTYKTLEKYAMQLHRIGKPVDDWLHGWRMKYEPAEGTIPPACLFGEYKLAWYCSYVWSQGMVYVREGSNLIFKYRDEMVYSKQKVES